MINQEQRKFEEVLPIISELTASGKIKWKKASPNSFYANYENFDFSIEIFPNNSHLFIVSSLLGNYVFRDIMIGVTSDGIIIKAFSGARHNDGNEEVVEDFLENFKVKQINICLK